MLKIVYIQYKKTAGIISNIIIGTKSIQFEVHS
jgi:hypothetical protein